MRKLLFLMLAFVGLTVGATTFSKPESWSEGIPAEGMAQLLVDIDPMSIKLPKNYEDLIIENTAIFYYSPTCPHCQQLSLKLMLWHKYIYGSV